MHTASIVSALLAVLTATVAHAAPSAQEVRFTEAVNAYCAKMGSLVARVDANSAVDPAALDVAALEGDVRLFGQLAEEAIKLQSLKEAARVIATSVSTVDADGAARFKAYSATFTKLGTCAPGNRGSRTETQLIAARAAAQQRGWEAEDADDRAMSAKPAGPNAPLSARVVMVQEDKNGDMPPGEVMRLFTTAAADRFVFMRKDVVHGRLIPRGESVLLSSAEDRQVQILTVDGQSALISPLDVSSKPMPNAKVMPVKAEWLFVSNSNASGGYRDIHFVETSGRALVAPSFLQLVPRDERIDTFLTLRDKTIACYDKVMQKLDPEKTSVNWALVRGTSVENLSSVYDKKACSACDCKGLDKKKRALARTVLGPLQQAKLATLKPGIDRVNAQFKRK